MHRVLSRYRLARLTWLDRGTGRVIRRYEHEKPGDLVHVDIKKLGRIPDGGGHRVLGRVAGWKNKTGSTANRIFWSTGPVISTRRSSRPGPGEQRARTDRCGCPLSPTGLGSQSS